VDGRSFFLHWFYVQSFFIGQLPILGAKILCKIRAPGKGKFFGWLVLRDCCWTAE
jgi:hypothetical protein